MNLKVLDLFCGMGGWSIGFHREGFTCYGLDMVDVGYPYEFWQTPIEEFRGGEYREMGFDVVIGSPPCNDFTTLRLANKVSPPKPERGKALVKEFRRVVELVSPKYWAMENVNGAVKYVRDIVGPPKFVSHPWYLWGDFPKFMMASSNRMAKGARLNGGKEFGSWLDRPSRWEPMSAFKRARIPLPISLGLAKACKVAILG